VRNSGRNSGRSRGRSRGRSSKMSASNNWNNRLKHWFGVNDDGSSDLNFVFTRIALTHPWFEQLNNNGGHYVSLLRQGTQL